MKLSPVQILIVRLAIGALFLSIGWDKYQEGWLVHPEHLAGSLNSYHEHAVGAQKVYLESVALPFSGAWSRMIILGEMCLGVSLLLGLLTRLSSALGAFMVLNFHAANGNLFSLNFFGSPWAAPLIAGLIAIFLARGGRWVGLDTILAKSNSSGMLW